MPAARPSRSLAATPAPASVLGSVRRDGLEAAFDAAMAAPTSQEREQLLAEIAELIEEANMPAALDLLSKRAELPLRYGLAQRLLALGRSGPRVRNRLRRGASALAPAGVGRGGCGGAETGPGSGRPVGERPRGRSGEDRSAARRDWRAGRARPGQALGLPKDLKAMPVTRGWRGNVFRRWAEKDPAAAAAAPPAKARQRSPAFSGASPVPGPEKTLRQPLAGPRVCRTTAASRKPSAACATRWRAPIRSGRRILRCH